MDQRMYGGGPKRALLLGVAIMSVKAPFWR